MKDTLKWAVATSSRRFFWIMVVLGLHRDTFTNDSNLEVTVFAAGGMVTAIAIHLIFGDEDEPTKET